MKRIMILLACVAIVLSGCNAGRIGGEIKREIKEEVADVKEDIKEITPENMIATDKENFIGEEEAKKIALSKAEISSDGVIFDRVELDNDNGIWQYEVEFRKDTTEYSADVNAVDGTIISWEIDND